jgi:ABC-type transporter Mla maintaining outer membrane lipid asymmetry ATPase subunit MlaF
MNSLPVLQMRDVSVPAQQDAGRIVATQVNWTVLPGEFWVVAAPQHSGKSDFLMMTGGLTSPQAGRFEFLGEPMPIFEEPRIGHRLKMGFVFDGGQLLNGMSVAENIALPLRYHRELTPETLESRVGELLELTGLTALANELPGQMGRAWRQRAGLARALALKPQVLLLDSPLTGLDVRHANWWLQFLGGLSRGQSYCDHAPMTLVVTADDLRPWRSRAGRYACLGDGRLMVLGDWGGVENSRDPVVRGLLNADAAE